MKELPVAPNSGRLILHTNSGQTGKALDEGSEHPTGPEEL